MPICEPSSEISPRSNSHNQFSSTPCQVREPLPGYQPTQDGLPERTMAGPIPFTFAQVEEMTRNFDIEGFLGEGGFGSVFKGYLPTRSGRRIPVAVKMLDTCGHQGEREWLTEVSFLGLLEHPNLVCLIGYCAEEDQRLLVYEFLPRGSLEFLLFGEDALANPLTWHQRLKIAFGAAEGLAYLHEEAEHQVIYRDFKTSNILLTNDLEVKLSDFGMAREGPDGEKTHVSTRVVGTVGYAAPEYVLTGHLTTKSDVYGFGVVLLELMTGRLALDKERPREEQSLVEWASPFLSAPSTLYRIMDPALRGRYSARGAQMVAAIVKECLQKKAKRRPKMSEVVAALRPVLDLHDMAGFCAEDMRAGLGGQVSPSMGGIGSIANNATGPQRFQRSESAGTLEEGAFKRRSISSSPKANADINAGDAVRVVVTMDGDCNQVPQACGAASRATITGNQKPRLPSPCQASPKGVISPNVAGSPWRAGRPRSLPAV
ncbi:unnamed protein product [Closterium sp. NIES-65]|nr:unnamed protein product [Closterium sp. NIES-65]CAI6002011.1 unnamed protein product [Closterium sp. NIES-65]